MEKFNDQFHKWEKAVADGKYTTESLLAQVETRGLLMPTQRTRIMEIGKTS